MPLLLSSVVAVDECCCCWRVLLLLQLNNIASKLCSLVMDDFVPNVKTKFLRLLVIVFWWPIDLLLRLKLWEMKKRNIIYLFIPRFLLLPAPITISFRIKVSSSLSLSLSFLLSSVTFVHKPTQKTLTHVTSFNYRFLTPIFDIIHTLIFLSLSHIGAHTPVKYIQAKLKNYFKHLLKRALSISLSLSPFDKAQS